MLYLLLNVVSITIFIFSMFYYFKLRKGGERRRDYKKYKLKKIFKQDLFKKLDHFFEKAGYPYGFNTESYILSTIISILATLYTLIMIGRIEATILAISTLLGFNLLIYVKYVDRKMKMRIALADIQDILYFQTKIGTPLDVILTHAARIAKKPLKIPLQEAAAKYKLRRDLESSLEILNRKTGLIEVKALTLILQQNLETGFSDQNHQEQGSMMKTNKRLKSRSDRITKRRNLIISAVLLFLCYMSMLIVPMLIDLFINVKKVLR